MKTTLVVTHTDLDGVIAGLLASMLANSKTNTLYTTPFQVDAQVQALVLSDIKRVIFTDLSPNKETLKQLSKKVDVLVFDHHESNQELADNNKNVINENLNTSDVPESATSLVAKHYKLIDKRPINKTFLELPIIKKLVAAVTAYDTWTFKEPNNPYAEIAPKLSILLYTFSTTIFVKHILKQISNKKNQESLLSQDDNELADVLLERMSKQIARDLVDAQVIDLSKELNDDNFKKVGFVIAEKNQSELADQLMKKTKTNSAIIFNNGKLSIRSKGTLDITKIAELLGGGGHINASGTCINLPAESILKDAISKAKAK